MKVLVAAEDCKTREFLLDLLQEHGHACTAVQDGANALRVLQTSGAPRVAIFDWLLPEIDGPNVCRRLRTLCESQYTYCILIAPRDLSAEQLKTIDSGADEVIAAPFEGSELIARLRSGKRIVDLQDQLLAAREALRFESTHDAVSGTLNRSGMREHLQRETERAKRFGTLMGALIVDIDHFRIINESFGYQAGDLVLREIAHRIRSTVRAYDVVGRYGPDEFLILSPECNATSLMVQAERVLTAISSTAVPFGDQQIIVTASIGAASLEELSGQEMVQAAENAMEQAKRNGRNTVEFARPFLVDAGAMYADVPGFSRPN